MLEASTPEPSAPPASVAAPSGVPSPAGGVPPVQVALARVMADVRAVGKDRRMDSAAGGYAYRSVDDVYDVLHGPLAAHGVLVVPDVERLDVTVLDRGQGKAERHVAATVRVRVIGPAGDELAFTAHGEGMDRRDRATQKAVTDAFKYALLRALCIPVTDGGDDPDADGGDHPDPTAHAAPAAAAASRGSTPAASRGSTTRRTPPARPDRQAAAASDGGGGEYGDLTRSQHENLRKMGIDDDARHDLARIVSDGRSASSSGLTGPERAQLMRAANSIATGTLVLAYADDGTPRLNTPDAAERASTSDRERHTAGAESSPPQPTEEEPFDVPF